MSTKLSASERKRQLQARLEAARESARRASEEAHQIQRQLEELGSKPSSAAPLPPPAPAPIPPTSPLHRRLSSITPRKTSNTSSLLRPSPKPALSNPPIFPQGEPSSKPINHSSSACVGVAAGGSPSSSSMLRKSRMFLDPSTTSLDEEESALPSDLVRSADGDEDVAPTFKTSPQRLFEEYETGDDGKRPPPSCVVGPVPTRSWKKTKAVVEVQRVDPAPVVSKVVNVSNSAVPAKLVETSTGVTGGRKRGLSNLPPSTAGMVANLRKMFSSGEERETQGNSPSQRKSPRSNDAPPAPSPAAASEQKKQKVVVVVAAESCPPSAPQPPQTPTHPRALSQPTSNSKKSTTTVVKSQGSSSSLSPPQQLNSNPPCAPQNPAPPPPLAATTTTATTAAANVANLPPPPPAEYHNGYVYSRSKLTSSAQQQQEATEAKQSQSPQSSPQQHKKSAPASKEAESTDQPSLVPLIAPTPQAESRSPKDSVYVFLRDECGAGCGFTYSADLCIREIVDKAVSDAALDPSQKYVLGISEVGLYLTSDAKQTSLRRMSFVQACNMAGIPPALELFCVGDAAHTPESVDAEKLALAIKSDTQVLRLVSDDFMTSTIFKFKDEVDAARRSFTKARLSSHASLHVEGEALFQYLYIQEELAVCYRGAEPPLKDRSVVVSFAVLYPGSKVQKIVQCPACIDIPNLMYDLHKRFSTSAPLVNPMESIQEDPDEVDLSSGSPGSGGGPARRGSAADVLAGTSPEDFVLKVTGSNEYLVMMDEKRNPLRLDDFDYVRKSVVAGELMEFTVVPRATLHTPPSEGEDAMEAAVGESSSPVYYDDFGSKVIDVLLARDIWRAPEEASGASVVPMSSFEAGRYRLTVVGCENARWPVTDDRPEQPALPYYLSVTAAMYHGDRLCAAPVATPVVTLADQSYGKNVLWQCDLEIALSLKRIPREARVCFTLCAVGSPSGDPTGKDSVPLAWCSLVVLDYRSRLQTGDFRLAMWEGEANPIGTCVCNTSDPNPTALFVKIHHPCAAACAAAGDPNLPVVVFSLGCNSSSKGGGAGAGAGGPLASSDPGVPAPAVAPAPGPAAEAVTLEGGAVVLVPKLRPEDAANFKRVITLDPLAPLSREDTEILWEYRELVRKSKPRSLPKVLRAVDWTIPSMVREAHRLLQSWERLRPIHALELLDAKFADSQVRRYAVECLEAAMPDRECADFLLQLIQALKYEPYHDSPLARFLLLRAVRNRNAVGHTFFWSLKSEMQVTTISERYGILLEAYLRGCGASVRMDIEKQIYLLRNLDKIARQVKTAQGKANRLRIIQEGLSRVSWDGVMTLPLDPRMSVRRLMADRCRFMDSKKLPLWLAFENAEKSARPVYVIFKVGDDIRQDILTLQLLRIMDSLWKKSGMDFRMQLYHCVSTAESTGMIEVVLDSETTGNIAKQQGGTSAVMRESTVTDWLRKSNQTEAEWARCVETFMLTCAGYCVATYVLGIGDRHSDNVMVSRRGHLFHIDFGHFLGNFKYALGVKRERAPFKFTPQFAHVFGGKDSPRYVQFTQLCCQAFNLLRHNGDLFINLFGLMLSTGIPELQTAEDIDYLRKAFLPDLDDVIAAEKFRRMIDEALKTTSQTWNDVVHLWAHR